MEKFTLKSKELFNAMYVVNKCVDYKSIHDNYKCMIFSVKDNILTLIGNKYPMCLSKSIKLNEDCDDMLFGLDEPKRLIDVAKDLKDNDITIELVSKGEGKVICVSYKGGKLELKAASFDETFESDSVYTHDLIFNNFKEPFNACYSAMSKDEFKPQMCGMCLNILGNEVNLVATDSHVLIKYKMFAESAAAKLLIPRAVCEIIKPLIKDYVVIHYNDDGNKAKIDVGECSIEFALTEGNYPDYNKVIPTQFKYEATFNRNLLLGVLKRMKLSKRIPTLVDMIFSKDSVKLISSNETDNTTIEESLETIFSSDDEFTVGFDDDVLMELLKPLVTDEIKMRFNDSTSACYVHTTYDYDILVMPRIKNNSYDYRN